MFNTLRVYADHLIPAVRRKTEQPHLSATVQAQRLSVFSRIARMSDESDAKQILTASPLEETIGTPLYYVMALAPLIRWRLMAL